MSTFSIGIPGDDPEKMASISGSNEQTNIINSRFVASEPIVCWLNLLFARQI